MRQLVIIALVASSHLAFAASARAQDPSSVAEAQAGADEAIDAAIEAKKRYAAGQKSVAHRQFVEAALHFEAANAFSPSGVALVSAALAWESANLPQRAADAYARALDEPGLRKTQIKHAQARLDALERSLGTIVVNGEDGMRAQLDDNVDVSLPARLHGSPGVHRLTIWSKGEIVGQRDVFLRLAAIRTESVPWNVEEPAPPPAPPPPPPPAPPPSTWKTVGTAMLGAGAAAAAGGLLLQLSANGSRGDAARTESPDMAAAMRSNADRAQAFAIGSWVAAGALVAGGLTVLAIRPGAEKRSVAISPTVGGAVIRGTF